MKTIEQQLDDMLPEDVTRRRRLAIQRIEYFENVAKNLRELGRFGLTAAQAAKNLKANLEKFREQNQGDSDPLDNKP